MSKVFVFAEGHGSELKKGSLEVLHAAHASGREVIAGVVGHDAATLAKLSGQNGAKAAFVAADTGSPHYNPDAYANVLSEMIKASGADVVLASATTLARDVFPRVAAKLDTGLASDCTSLELKADGVTVRRPLFAGKCTAEVEFVDSPVRIVLMRPNQLPVGTAPGGEATVREFPAPPAGRITTKEVVAGASTKADLTEANVIVSGGRGMQNGENFKLLQDMADVLGASVGASRAVADAGWVPHGMQVGQTGKTVAPSLYIACGISGAIQHLAGMSGSKVIVAINKDADAPIFAKATYGLVGDLFEIIPKVTEEFRKALRK